MNGCVSVCQLPVTLVISMECIVHGNVMPLLKLWMQTWIMSSGQWTVCDFSCHASPEIFSWLVLGDFWGGLVLLHVKHHVEIPFDWMTCFVAAASLETWSSSPLFLWFMYIFSFGLYRIFTFCFYFTRYSVRENIWTANKARRICLNDIITIAPPSFMTWSL